MQWVERLIELWCFMCNGWKDWLRSDVYMHVVERLIELWCSICTGRKDWLNSDVLYALGWLNSDVLYAWGGKIDWTLMFCMHGVERFIELLCFICMGWKDWLNSDVSYASGWLNSDVLYAWGGKIDWTLMFYMHGVERSIELCCFISMGWKDWLNSDVSYAREWLNSDVLYARGGKINWILMFYIYAWGGKIDWTLMFMCMGWKDWLNSDVSYARGFLQVFCNFITIYEKSFLKFFKRM